MNVRSANLAQGVTLATESPLRDLAAIIRSRTPLNRGRKQRGTTDRSHGAPDRPNPPAPGLSLDCHRGLAGLLPVRSAAASCPEVAGNAQLHQILGLILSVRPAGFSSLLAGHGPRAVPQGYRVDRSEEHTSELQS